MRKVLRVLGAVMIVLLAAVASILIFDPDLRLNDLPTKLVEAPRAEIILNGEKSIFLDYGDPFEDPGAEAWLIGAGGKREPIEVSTTPFDPTQLGTTEIRYSAVYNGETLISVSRLVTVSDHESPVITLLNEPGERDYSAFDNADGDISDRVERVEEADRIVYSVSDSSGNGARAEREKMPVLELTGGERTQVAADYRFEDPGYSAIDMYGRDITDRVEIEGEVKPRVLGEYELHYTVTDDFGQTVSASRTVEIVPAELPETVLQEKVIYLTFDDGPAAPTEELLDMLAKYDAKVTFFVTYTDPRYVDLIGRAYREGHSIGLHGYAHDASKIYTGVDAYFEYFEKMQDIIYEQTGSYTRIVRFVGGSSNTSSAAWCPGIMTKLAEDLTMMGYRYYDWNIQPENAELNVTSAFNNIRYNASYICEEGKDAPISLQHDTGGWNIAVTERVIQWGLENGYTFKGIDLTTPEVHHWIRN